MRIVASFLLTALLLLPARADFALDMYARLSSETKGNFFYSPYSLSVALAMVEAGARGQTLSEMEKVLGPVPAKPVTKATLEIANRAWVGTKLLPAYLETLSKKFGADAVTLVLDDSAVKTINAWVSQKTHGKIPELLKKLPANARLVLTNAIYFKGAWKTGFDPKVTCDGEFWVSTRQSVKAKLMALSSEFAYAKLPDLQVLAMPYKGDDLSMVILLPTQRDGLPALEKKLTANWSKWTSELTPQEVSVRLPRFQTSLRVDPVPALKALGMKSVFDDSADLSGMNGQRNLKVGMIVHQAVVEVNEEGTEAAAATAVVVVERGMPRTERFTCDHPFLYAIRENKTGTILFMGRLEKP